MTDCSCKHTPTSCPEGSAWNGKECICLPPAEGCAENYSWRYHECRCVCDPQPEDVCDDAAALEQEFGYAPNPSRIWFWDQSECRCAAAPVTCPDDTADAHWIYSSLIGDCCCSPGTEGCATNQYFDTESCVCRCPPKDCNDGFEWDTVDCTCKCS